MDKSRALHEFWSSFGWKAYDEHTVPSSEMSPEMPRITYESAIDEFDESISLSASLWDRSYSWAALSQKAEQIYDYIGRGGRVVPFDGGYIWIRRGSPFAQRMSDEDDTIRRIFLNVEVEFSAS